MTLRIFIHSLLLIVSLPVAAQFPDWRPWEGSSLVGTGVDPLPYKAVPAFEQHPWRQPVAMIPVPSATERYLILEHSNQIWLLNADGTRTLFAKIPGRMINATFSPNFAEDRLFYLRYSSKGTNRVHRLKVGTTEPLTADVGTAEVVLEWHTVGHRGGGIDFGPDGYLYIATGDAQKPGDPANTGQKTNDLLGSVLRLDVSKKPYGVPPDNPFVGMKDVRPEIWSYGLRNPWRTTFRPGTNELWIGDNGNEKWEMVSVASKGSNHGWSMYEGTHLFRPGNSLEGPTLTHTPPVIEHSHHEMRSVIGGVWYQGKLFTELRGHYIYGDHVTGKVWAVDLQDGKPTTPRRLASVGRQIVSFAQTRGGEIMVTTFNGGIYKLERAPQKKLRPVPEKLSQTGLFASVPNHTPAPGLVPYAVNSPVFNDKATTERFIGIPRDKMVRIRYAHRAGNLLPPLRTRAGLDRWEMPDGTLIAQTFSLPDAAGKPRRVETQISLNDDGEWRFLSYRWQDDQQDAVLVPENGAEAEIPGVKRRWRYPSRAECATCHTHLNMFTPGLHLAQLNRTIDYAALGGGKLNQIDAFKKLKFVPGGTAVPKKNFIMPRADDTTASIEDRARAYLHTNCGHCHREAGIGGRAEFQLLNWMKMDLVNATDVKPLVGLPGSSEKTRLIAPGDPAHSDIYRRIATDQPGRMPLFGTTRVDKEGAQLIHDWIKSLK
jgi:glucose/arabinose dehydrogenase/mono/diheme cytochrome c family protein